MYVCMHACMCVCARARARERVCVANIRGSRRSNIRGSRRSSPYRYGSSPAAPPSSPPSLASIPDRRSISCENACFRGSVQNSVRRYALRCVQFSRDVQPLCTCVYTHPRPHADELNKSQQQHTHTHTHTHTFKPTHTHTHTHI